jgi:zinc/manganese transport system substrate-binding protein
MLKVAKAMSERFSKLDSANSSNYETGYKAFDKKISAKITEWEKKMSSYKGTKVVAFHASWTYLLNWLGFSAVGFVEPKPGITPDPSYLATLVSTMKSSGVKIVIAESYYNPKVAKLVADKAGAKLLSLPANVGGSTSATDYVSLIDDILNQLETALK